MTNIAEILKDAPKRLELYSPVYGKINLRKYTHNIFPIVCTDIEDTNRFFTSSGKFRDDFDAECILFPSKEHKSWDNWQEILFQVGDIVSSIQLPTPYIITDIKNNKFTYTCSDNIEHSLAPNNYRYATPEEREQFMTELNANGYKWNYDTKQIEKIEQQYTPKYKVGDWITGKYIGTIQIIGITNNYYYFSNNTISDIYSFDNNKQCCIASELDLINIGIKEKPFSINELKPFDKVLMRNEGEYWRIEIFQSYFKGGGDYIVYSGITHQKHQCIPYNDETKHLLGTTDDCPDKYKTW